MSCCPMSGTCAAVIARVPGKRGGAFRSGKLVPSVETNRQREAGVVRRWDTSINTVQHCAGLPHEMFSFQLSLMLSKALDAPSVCLA